MEKYAEIYDRGFMEWHMGREFDWEEACASALLGLLRPRSVLDVGCGAGRWLVPVVASGREALGIDVRADAAREVARPEVARIIGQADASSPVDLKRKFDCVWSFEVGEHIPPERSMTLALNLVRHAERLIVMTAAPPGQGGPGHINCREKEEWVGMMQRAGAYRKEDLERAVAAKWMAIPGRPDYIIKNLMVFDLHPVSPELRRASERHSRYVAAGLIKTRASAAAGGNGAAPEGPSRARVRKSDARKLPWVGSRDRRRK